MRLLLSTFGTAGDIIPFARLARALLGRDHTVTVHSWEHYRTWFPREVAFVPAGDVTAQELEETFDWALQSPTYIEQTRRFARLFYGLGAGTKRARAGYEQARTTFVRHDLAVMNALDHVGQAAAEDVGLPWMSYTSRPPSEPTLADALFNEVDVEMSDLVTAITGKHRRIRVFRDSSPLRTLAACSPHLAGPSLLPSVLLTGGWIEPPGREELPPGVEALLADGPALFVTFGTMPDVNGRTAALAAAAANAGWRAIIQVLTPVSAPIAERPEILLCRERLPFSALLPRVAAVVHHGSVGTTHEVIRAGKPSFVVPHMGDQFYWAAMLHARGLGPAPLHFGELDLAALAARFTALHDDECRRRAEALAPKLALEDGVAFAVRHIEEQSS